MKKLLYVNTVFGIFFEAIFFIDVEQTMTAEATQTGSNLCRVRLKLNLKT